MVHQTDSLEVSGDERVWRLGQHVVHALLAEQLLHVDLVVEWKAGEVNVQVEISA